MLRSALRILDGPGPFSVFRTPEPLSHVQVLIAGLLSGILARTGRQGLGQRVSGGGKALIYGAYTEA